MCVGERASGDIVTMFYVFCVGKPLRIKKQEGMQAIILSLKDAKEVFQHCKNAQFLTFCISFFATMQRVQND